MSEAGRPIPALIVSGFLGSGKTTLVRALLAAAQAEGARVAFISNELGELGIDQALLGGGEAAMVELAGGCICCALNDELYTTLLRLREEMDPDRIVIETSGVAIPSDVQLTLWQPPIRDWISEEAVVTVVSADQLLSGGLDDTGRLQVEAADLAVLSKVDLVDPALVAGLAAQVRGMNPGIGVVPAVQGDVDPRLLLAAAVTADARVEEQDHDPDHDHDHDHDHAAHAHLHGRYESFNFRPQEGLDDEALERQLRAFGALRVKGFVSRGGETFLVQGVGRRMEIRPWAAPVPPALHGVVVVIRAREARVG